MPKFEEIHQLLRAGRKKLGLSQEQFALALGIKLSRLQKWESGVNEPRLTIPELRRLRNLNREVFDALISGFLLVAPPPIPPASPHTDPPQPSRTGKARLQRDGGMQLQVSNAPDSGDTKPL